MKKQLFTHSFTTSRGVVHTAAIKEGLVLITLPGSSAGAFKKSITGRFPDYEITAGGGENKKAERQIKAYFSGKLKKFSLKLSIKGTPFQKKVLQKTAAIPFGKITT